MFIWADHYGLIDANIVAAVKNGLTAVGAVKFVIGVPADGLSRQDLI